MTGVSHLGSLILVLRYEGDDAKLKKCLKEYLKLHKWWPLQSIPVVFLFVLLCLKIVPLPVNCNYSHLFTRTKVNSEIVYVLCLFMQKSEEY
jgi:hypothetical protein